MRKLLILSIFVLWCFHTRANYNVSLNLPIPSNYIYKDSSNYQIKVVREDITHCQIRFTIVDEKNNPLDAAISLNDKNGKGISGVLTNEDGLTMVMVYDDIISKIIVYRIGYGVVRIPLDKIKDKIVEIRVQLYPFTTSN